MREKPDIVLLDLVMPKIDGMELLLKIKEQKTGARVFIMTGISDPTIINDATKLGADDIIMKPSSIEQLYTAIVRHLSLMYESYEP